MRATRSALFHQLAVALLGASTLTAAAVWTVPALTIWSALAPWIAVWGLVVYVALAAAYARTLPTPTTPELQALRAVRQAIAARAARESASAGRDRHAEMAQVLTRTVGALDAQVEPALRRLLQRRAALGDYLSQIERGRVPAPDEPVLERLRTAHARQSEAIDACVRQAANAAGTLVALLQSEEETGVVSRATAWAGDLLRLHDRLASELSLSDEEAGAASAPASSTAPAAGDALDATAAALAVLRERYVTGQIDLAGYEQEVEKYLSLRRRPPTVAGALH